MERAVGRSLWSQNVGVWLCFMCAFSERSVSYCRDADFVGKASECSQHNVLNVAVLSGSSCLEGGGPKTS